TIGIYRIVAHSHAFRTRGPKTFKPFGSTKPFPCVSISSFLAMSPHFFGTLFAFFAFVLLVFVNLGQIFAQPVLQDIYFVRANVNGQFVQYGMYGACQGTGNTVTNCSAPQIIYANDFSELLYLAQINGFTVDVTHTTLVKMIFTFLPAGIFAFLAMTLGSSVRRHQNNLPAGLSSVFSLLALILCLLGLAMELYVYWTVLDMLQQHSTFVIARVWGPATYMAGAAAFALLVALVCFMMTCLSSRRESKDWD
ncbi:hypothetical protein BC937DRAFT_93181, partial [Endogone sp. FLAS-F59071]